MDRDRGPYGSRRAFLIAAGTTVGGVAVGTGAAGASDPVRVGAGLAALDKVAADLGRETTGIETVEADGFEAFLDGEVDVQHAPRPMTAGERERARANGIEAEEHELPVGGLATLTPSEGWCRCLPGVTDETSSTNVELWSVVESATDDGRATEFPAAGVDVLVRGTRADQYAIGHGGLGYHEAEADEFAPANGSGDLVARLGFVAVDRDALGREPVTELFERYDGVTSDAEPLTVAN